jgi:hypothetical protein
MFQSLFKQLIPKHFCFILLERDLFHAPIFFAQQFMQAREQLRADARGLAGEVDQVSLAVFKNLEREFVPAMK